MIFALLSACAPAPTDPVTVPASVVAAEGARIELDDGAWLDIGPGVLEADGDVSFARTTCDGVFRAEAFGSCRYDVASPGRSTSPA